MLFPQLKALFWKMRRLQSLPMEFPLTLLFRMPTPALLGAYLEELVREDELEKLASAMDDLSPEERDKLLEELND